MRERPTGTGVVERIVLPQTVDGVTVGDLDVVVERGACSLVVDVSEATVVEEEVLPILARLAQKLENAGGMLSVTAHGGLPDARVTRTLSSGDLTCVLGVHAVLDKAIARRLTIRAGGEALR